MTYSLLMGREDARKSLDHVTQKTIHVLIGRSGDLASTCNKVIDVLGTGRQTHLHETIQVTLEVIPEVGHLPRKLVKTTEKLTPEELSGEMRRQHLLQKAVDTHAE